MWDFLKGQRDVEPIIPPSNSKIQMPKVKETFFDKYNFRPVFESDPLNGSDAVYLANKRYEKLLSYIDNLQQQIDELKKEKDDKNGTN